MSESGSPQPPDREPVTEERRALAASERYEGANDRRRRFYGRREIDKRKEINKNWLFVAVIIIGVAAFAAQYTSYLQRQKITHNQTNIANIIVATNIWGCQVVTVKPRAKARAFVFKWGQIKDNELTPDCKKLKKRSQERADRALSGENILTGQVP